MRKSVVREHKTKKRRRLVCACAVEIITTLRWLKNKIKFRPRALFHFFASSSFSACCYTLVCCFCLELTRSLPCPGRNKQDTLMPCIKLQLIIWVQSALESSEEDDDDDSQSEGYVGRCEGVGR